MKICLPEEVIFLEASIINFYISSLSGMWKHFRKVERPPLDVSDHCLGESGRETTFEDFKIAELDGTLKIFCAGARKDMYMYNL
jgi:hypothetical protein